MKKIAKKTLLVLVSLALIAISVIFVACDNTNSGKYDIKNFYGTYEEIVNDHYTVNFVYQSANSDYGLGSRAWDIVSIEQDSFTYLDSGGEIKVKQCDELLMKAIKRLITLLDSKVTVSKGMLYLNDTGIKMEFDVKHVDNSPQQNVTVIHKSGTNHVIGRCQYIENTTFENKMIEIYLFDDYVIDEHGVEWEIIVSKKFK